MITKTQSTKEKTHNTTKNKHSDQNKHTHTSTITLNINDLNFPVKKGKTKSIKKQNPSTCCLQETQISI